MQQSCVRAIQAATVILVTVLAIVGSLYVLGIVESKEAGETALKTMALLGVLTSASLLILWVASTGKKRAD
ncbi:MAG: hypothetical protein FJZ95_09840 [Chloroflexi bacterium]|nr:hypothetical protein [Chloroflexota bacterium]